MQINYLSRMHLFIHLFTNMDATQELFGLYQKKLDAKNDKFERLVKLSRDITIESKRLIFQLHRCS